MEPNDTSLACTSISEKLSHLSVPLSECTIYRVHGHLRNVNDKAYDPEIIAVGPYHHKKDNTKMMKEHKLLYLNVLLQRDKKKIDTFASAIGPLEPEARNCYAEPISLKPSEFIEMLVLDGCFIIELVRKCSMVHLRERNDPIFHMDWIMNSLQRDLLLFENQIPFFILCKLFDLIEVPNQHDRLIYLLLSFFNNLYPGKVRRTSESGDSHKIKHVLDLIHGNWLPSFDPNTSDEGMGMGTSKRWRFIKNASWLREANVKFRKDEGVTLFDVRFEKGSMHLSPLIIEDRTESFFRNLIAYEQYFQYSKPCFVTDYVKFLDCLIDSSRDVGILSHIGIIDNWLGDDEAVANMFNKLTDSVTGPGRRFMYAKIFDSVIKHCDKRRNRWMAKLRINYLNSPWAIISILAAVALLLLTVAQTVCSILQVV